MKSIKYFEETIQTSLKDCIEKSLVKFRRDERVTVKSPS